MDKMRVLILEFLKSDENRKWIKADGINVYIRKAKRNIDNRLTTTLDISSVVVCDVRKKGKGKFTDLLELCREINPYEYLFVENVHEQRFADFFQRQGMTRTGHPDIPCFYELNPNFNQMK